MKKNKDTEETNDAKAVIARIFSAIINADGVLSAKELQYLEETIMPKYGLKMKDFEEKNYTFAEAVNYILSPEGVRYLEKRNQNFVSLSRDMEELARIDGGIHPKEALLCKAFSLAIERDTNVSLMSFKNHELRFSKHEIIYVENEWDNDINREILNNYEIIRYMLQGFGFQFIYIPKVREVFFNYLPEYKLELIKYYYPERYSERQKEELLMQFDNKLQSEKQYNDELQSDIDGVTKSFCEMLFEGIINQIKPSFLIKIGTTQKRNPDGLTDFIVLGVDKKGALHTIVEFMKKYDELCDRNSVLVQRGDHPCGFNSKSFHKTFLEYLYNKVIAINVFIEKTSLVFCFNNIDKVKMSKGLQTALYLTELYCSCLGESFVNATLNNREDDTALRAKMEKQYELFHRIYFGLNGVVYNRLIWEEHQKKYVRVPFEVFYAEFTKNHAKISELLNRDEYRGLQYLKKFFPPYDINTKSVLIPPTICYVFDCRKKDKDRMIGPNSLISWVDGLSIGMS